MQDACALALVVGAGPASAPLDDWLTMPEGDLEAMTAESLALMHRADSGSASERAAALLAVLHQVAVARVVVRALGLPLDEARAAMRSDHALGYFFGLASGCGAPDAAASSERRVGRTLMLLHDMVYGREAAEQLAADLVAGGTMAVGEAFADGILAAAADMAELARWRGGVGGALPGRLLDCLPTAGWAREPAGDRRH